MATLNQQYISLKGQLSIVDNTQSQLQTEISVYRSQLQNIQAQVTVATNNLDVVLSRYNSALAQINRDKDNVNLMTQRLNQCRNVESNTISTVGQTGLGYSSGNSYDQSSFYSYSNNQGSSNQNTPFTQNIIPQSNIRAIGQPSSLQSQSTYLFSTSS